MSYTEADLENIKRAILALATGERVVKVALGDKQIEYGQAQLKDLRALRAEIEANLELQAGKSRVFLTQTSKGL